MSVINENTGAEPLQAQLDGRVLLNSPCFHFLKLLKRKKAATAFSPAVQFVFTKRSTTPHWTKCCKSETGDRRSQSAPAHDDVRAIKKAKITYWPTLFSAVVEAKGASGP